MNKLFENIIKGCLFSSQHRLDIYEIVKIIIFINKQE
jgi:hypothetical protein